MPSFAGPANHNMQSAEGGFSKRALFTSISSPQISMFRRRPAYLDIARTNLLNKQCAVTWSRVLYQVEREVRR